MHATWFEKRWLVVSVALSVAWAIDGALHAQETPAWRHTLQSIEASTIARRPDSPRLLGIRYPTASCGTGMPSYARPDVPRRNDRTADDEFGAIRQGVKSGAVARRREAIRAVRRYQVLEGDPRRAIMSLEGVLRTDDPVHLCTAADAISRFHHQAHSAAPLLERRLDHADAAVRAAMISALGRVGPTTPAVFRAALDDEDSRVKVAAIRAVRRRILHHRFGDALRSRLQDEKPRVRLEAAAALVEAGIVDDTVVRTIAREALTLPPVERRPALEALQTLGPAARAAAPALADAIRPGVPDAADLARTYRAVADPAGVLALFRRTLSGDLADDVTLRAAIAHELLNRPPLSAEGSAMIDLALDFPERFVGGAAGRAIYHLGDRYPLAKLRDDPRPEAQKFWAAARDRGDFTGEENLRFMEREAMRQLREGDADAKCAALNAIRRRGEGKRLLPGILIALDDDDPNVRALGMVVLAARRVAAPAVRTRIEAMLAHPAPVARMLAAYYFGACGPSMETLPRRDLSARLRDDDAHVRAMAAWALGQVPDVSSISSLAAALEDEETVTRAVAFAFLAHADAFPAKVNDALQRTKISIDRLPPEVAARVRPNETMARTTKRLADDDATVRRSAIMDLLRLHHDRDAVIERLITLVNDPDDLVALRALAGLAGYGPPEKAHRVYPETARAIPAAVEILQRRRTAPKNLRYRKLEGPALALIRSLGPRASAAVRDPSWLSPSVEAFYTIAAIGPGAAPAIPRLIEGLETPHDYHVANGAAHALGEIGRKAEAAIPHLLAASVSPLMGPACWTALGRIHPRPASLLALAMDTVDERVADRRPRIFSRPRRLRPDEVRWTLADARALRALAPTSPHVLPYLVRTHDWSQVKAFGGAAAPAVPFLIPALERPRKIAAAQALAAIGKRAGPALPALRRALERHEAGSYPRRAIGNAIAAIERAMK